jgi:hypothetical protein
LAAHFIHPGYELVAGMHMTRHHLLLRCKACNGRITTFHVACSRASEDVIRKTRVPRGRDTCIRRRNLVGAVGGNWERHRCSGHLHRAAQASDEKEKERLEAPPPPASAPMARRHVLLFLKPFDVYPPRPCAGASPSSLNTSPPTLPRAAIPKVAPLSFSL